MPVSVTSVCKFCFPKGGSEHPYETQVSLTVKNMVELRGKSDELYMKMLLFLIFKVCNMFEKTIILLK